MKPENAHDEYEKPMVVDYGELTELTAAAGTGKKLDASFTRGTPFDTLTFS